MNPTDPTDRARAAFDDLDTPEKTAFVIEATFSTIGAALRETGQRLADVITEFDPDSFFRDATAPAPEAEPVVPKPGKKTGPKASTAKKAAAKKAAAKKPASAPPPPGAKTAGRPGKEDDTA